MAYVKLYSEHFIHTNPSSKVWHSCRSKPPNCRLARAARVVCAQAQPGTIVCSLTPQSFVGAGGIVGVG